MNDPINQLFYRINNGEFRDTLPRQNRNGNAFYRELRLDRMLPEDHQDAIRVRKGFNKFDWKCHEIGAEKIALEVKKLNKQWIAFKRAWGEDGLVPVGSLEYNAFGYDKPGFVLHGVRTFEAEKQSLRDRNRFNNRTREAARQVAKGTNEMLRWRRLTEEQQKALRRFGMT